MMIITTCKQFQFQNGSIKAWKDGEKYKATDWFQFQNGSIKAREIVQTRICDEVFQFQNGSIKAICQHLNMIFSISFNSKMVRLKPVKINNQ